MWNPSSARALRRASLGMLLAFLTSGCGASAKSDFDVNNGEVEDPNDAELSAIFQVKSEDAYRITEYDQLEIVFFTHPEQNRFVRVRPDGKISMPFLGDVDAAGRAPVALAQEIQERYAEVLVAPRVDVLVQESGARYYVFGEVNDPGEFAYERRVDLFQAVARASGYNTSARLNNLVLLRKAPDGTGAVAVLDLRTYMNDPTKRGQIEIQPFDIVWVPKDNVSRWDNFTRKLFEGVLSAEETVIKGWSLGNFNEVFRRDGNNP